MRVPEPTRHGTTWDSNNLPTATTTVPSERAHATDHHRARRAPTPPTPTQQTQPTASTVTRGARWAGWHRSDIACAHTPNELRPQVHPDIRAQRGTAPQPAHARARSVTETLIRGAQNMGHPALTDSTDSAPLRTTRLHQSPFRKACNRKESSSMTKNMLPSPDVKLDTPLAASTRLPHTPAVLPSLWPTCSARSTEQHRPIRELSSQPVFRSSSW